MGAWTLNMQASRSCSSPSWSASRFSTARPIAETRWSWTSWGAVVAAVLWLVASLGFSFYARYFGSYNATYGTLAGIVVLLLWLLISFAVVILGAEINAALEAETGAAATTVSETDSAEGGSADGRGSSPTTCPASRHTQGAIAHDAVVTPRLRRYRHVRRESCSTLVSRCTR